MTIDNETFFYLQVAFISASVFVLFVLYMALASQRAKSIKLLEEKNRSLTEQLVEAKRLSPDVLAQNLSKSFTTLVRDIERLNEDRGKNKDLIEEKVTELHALREESARLRNQMELARDSLDDIVCPYCGAPMSTQVFYPESSHAGSVELEIEGNYVSYECGLIINIKDGREMEPCGAFLTVDESA
jgi:hypothetical protein